VKTSSKGRSSKKRRRKEKGGTVFRDRSFPFAQSFWEKNGNESITASMGQLPGGKKAVEVGEPEGLIFLVNKPV